MSFVVDHIIQLDAQLDRLQVHKPASGSSTPDVPPALDDELSDSERQSPITSSSNENRNLKLQSAIRTLSAASSSKVLLPPKNIVALLNHIPHVKASEWKGLGRTRSEEDLEWLLVSKASIQAYGLILAALLEQNLPLSHDIDYWNSVLGSYKYSSLYTIQVLPLSFYTWAKSIRARMTRRLGSMQLPIVDTRDKPSLSVPERWRMFYGLLRDTVRERSLAHMRNRLLSPLAQSRMDARSRKHHLQRLREMSASGLGLLMDECMILDVNDEGSLGSKGQPNGKDEWQGMVARSIVLMESVLKNITLLQLGSNDFVETVFANVDEDASGIYQNNDLRQTAKLAGQIQHLLLVHLPQHIQVSDGIIAKYGRPSWIVRYWLPGTILILSSSTVLRVLVRRKAKLLHWVRDLGATSIDFWYNWVVEPAKKVVGTIRHDKESEIALMSRESLQGDRASLERMVTDFVVDNPAHANGEPPTAAQIAEISSKVREGDLSPVLRAYERDLRSPFIGTVKGNLVRTLLIQVQKTKVDIEVALGGIDNLLRSQELVFGFLGLTPGVLVFFGLVHWLRGIAAGQGSRQARKHESLIRTLRNVDRILVESLPTDNGMLLYKDHGLLLCEVHQLRQRASQILPKKIFNEFLEDISDLVDLRAGINRQTRVVERIRWAYSQWLR